MHGLVTITEDHVDVGTRYISSAQNTTHDIGSKQRANGVKKQSLGAIVGTYKAAVTRQNRMLHGEKLLVSWQIRYHDHIVRSERALNQLREYILVNPARWAEDVFYQEISGNE